MVSLLMLCNAQHHVVWLEPLLLQSELIALSAGTSKVTLHIAIDLPAIAACSFFFTSVACILLALLLCSASADKFCVSADKRQIRMMHLLQLFFLIRTNFANNFLLLASTQNFKPWKFLFPFFKCCFFEIFWSLRLSMLQITKNSNLISYCFLKFVNKAAFWYFTLTLFYLHVFISLTAFAL